MHQKSIKPKLFKAKIKDSNLEVVGAYYAYPTTTYCFEKDYLKPVSMRHVIIHDEMTDWGLPNQLRAYEIDPDTLEEVQDTPEERRQKRQRYTTISEEHIS